MSKTKETSFVSDALRLMLITVIAGLLLGLVYTVTYEPIQAAQNATTIAAYKQVFPDAADFQEDENGAALIEANAASLAEQGFGNVLIDKVVNAVDANGQVVGHIINASSKDGYGGLVSISVGIQADGQTVNGIAFLSISESAGLGMNARDTDWYKQFNGKKGEKFEVTKAGDGELDNNKINAISGATITSRAVTNAVNAALYFVNNGLKQ